MTWALVAEYLPVNQLTVSIEDGGSIPLNAMDAISISFLRSKKSFQLRVLFVLYCSRVALMMRP